MFFFVAFHVFFFFFFPISVLYSVFCATFPGPGLGNPVPHRYGPIRKRFLISVPDYVNKSHDKRSTCTGKIKYLTKCNPFMLFTGDVSPIPLPISVFCQLSKRVFCSFSLHRHMQLEVPIDRLFRKERKPLCQEV